MSDTLRELAIAHALLRLAPLHRALRAAVERQRRVASRLGPTDVTALCVTDAHAEELLSAIEDLSHRDDGPRRDAALEPEELARERALRDRVHTIGGTLPIDALASELHLSPFEQEALLLCAAPELDRAYVRIFGYVIDDLSRPGPSIELLCGLTASSLVERLGRRASLGPHGRLRRLGLLRPIGDAATELGQALRLAPGVLDRLIGEVPSWRDRFFDPDAVALDDACPLAALPDGDELERLAAGLETGTLGVVGVWGRRRESVDDAVLAIAAAASRPLHRGRWQATSLQAALDGAAARGAVLWLRIEGGDAAGPQATESEDVLDELLARSSVPIVLSGSAPRRPTALLSRRDYAEVRLRDAPSTRRRTLWQRELPEVSDEAALDVAARFRLSLREVAAVSRNARTLARLSSNGRGHSPQDFLDEACTLVTQQHGLRFAQLVHPKRGPEDLVLVEDLHRRVLEIASFYKTLLRVDGDWGFGRVVSGGGGLKALFTGDSGTGKTLAAEVIARQLGHSLVKVDLGSLVSKWLGETEQHLEIVFREAEDSHAVLFFDEADALFGKRGEIQRGTDRYANLEVGFLLQRLEDYGGLVILASNLKDEIDEAFIRRFQIVLHFPRPTDAERRRLWHVAFPEGAPLDPEIDLEALAGLDMTGASIVGAARMSALIAAHEGSSVIRSEHVRAGVVRQYQHEARLLDANRLAQLDASCSARHGAPPG